MSNLDAFLLGVLEGLSEYLPVSSTGHLILLSTLLHREGEASAAFAIVIQFGAILAVLVHYRGLLRARLQGLFSRDPVAIRLVLAIALGFAPAALLGLIARKAIKARLFGPVPVALALIAGGIVMLVVEAARRRKQLGGVRGLEHVSWQRAIAIGFAQCTALWPGMSRSMSTIVGGQLAGLATATAAEFSFLLGVPTLGAAALYEAYKSREVLFTDGALMPLLIGLVVSFVAAWLVIAAFIRYLQRSSLAPFAIYRIALGLFVLFLAMQAAGSASAPSNGE